MKLKPAFKYISLLIYTTLLAGCITTEYNAATHRQDIFFYSTEKEVKIGKNISDRVKQEYELSSNPKLNKKIYEIGKKIAEVCDRQAITYHFDIIEEDEKNAFSLPGGYIYIYKGLLDLLETDDEIAFVLAHEIGHVVGRHSIKRLQANWGANLLLIGSTQVETSNDSVGTVSLMLAQIISGYAKEDEFLADKLATEYLKKANFDPAAGIEVLKKLEKAREEESPHRISYFRSHPFAAQRIRRIKQTLGKPLEFEDIFNY